MTELNWAVGIVLMRTRNLRFTREEALAICNLCDEPEENGECPSKLTKCRDCPAGKKIGGPLKEWQREKAKLQ
jgi:hypothetical protein